MSFERACTETDFITYGVELEGALLQRASNGLLDWEELSATSGYKEDVLLNVVIRLVRVYVRCQEIIFRPHRDDDEEWVTKRRVWTLMNARLQDPLRRALEVRDEIERASGSSELCAVALEIIRQYETYRMHRARIDDHVRTERRILESKRQEFLIALENRDGRVCKGSGCKSVENLRIDHIRPLTLRGFSVLDNLQLLCDFCNGSKGDRTMNYLEHMNAKRRVGGVEI